MNLQLRYFNMDRIKQNIAQFIWEARVELGIPGDSDSDGRLTDRCMFDCGNQQIDYETVFIWLSENYNKGEQWQ